MQDNILLGFVRVGADALDRVRPGWREEINSERLDMCSTEDDVLGQLFGSFDTGIAQLKSRLKTDHDVASSDFLITRGFAVMEGPGADEESALLTQTWRDYLVGNSVVA